MIYPVDLDARYVVHNTVTLETTSPKTWPRTDGMEVQGLDADLVILKIVVDAKPAYDPLAISLKSSDVIDVPAEEYRREWSIVPLSAEALADIQETADLEAEQAQAISIYQDLKNGAGNSNQRIARVEKVLAHLLRKEYRP